MRVCLSLLISIFAAHLQHVHADGLFNNGLHFEEEEENIIAQAKAISADLWQAMLDWAKTENRLSLIERRNISGYIKRKENGRLIKKVNQAENAIALKSKAESLGFTFGTSL